jgi:hypothetical protein
MIEQYFPESESDSHGGHASSDFVLGIMMISCVGDWTYRKAITNYLQYDKTGN